MNPELPHARRALGRFLAFSCVIVPVLAVVGEPLQRGLYLFYAVVAIVLVIRCSLRLRGDVRLVVSLMVLAGISTTLGSVVDAMLASTDANAGFPSITDAFPLISYALFIMAIAFIVRRRNPRLGPDPILDSLVAGVSAGVVQWTLVVLPFLSDPANSSEARLGVVVFSSVSLMLVVLAILALVAGSVPTTSNRLLAAGLVTTFAVDVAATLVADSRAPESLVAAGSVLILLLGGAGLLHPTVVRLLERAVPDIARLSRRRITVLAFALISPPLILVAEIATGAPTVQVMLPALGSAVLAPLVLVRLGRLVRQNERLAAQEGTLRLVGEQLVESARDEDVATALDDGLRALVNGDLSDAGLVMAPFTGEAVGWTPELAPALRAAVAEVNPEEVPANGEVMHLHSVGIDGTWYAAFLVIKRELRGVLMLGTTRELTDDQRNAITALCRQGAIAMRAVERTEELVRERAERRFGTLIEHSSDIVTILDANGRLVYTSPVAKRLLGLEPEPGFELNIPQLVNRDDMAQARALLEEVRAHGYATTELRLRHVNGTYLWFELQATNLLDDPDVAGILINARAVDDRKAAEELLRLSEARFKSLVHNNTDLVMVVDEREAITYSSPSSLAMVGDTSDALFGQSMSAVFTSAGLDWDAKLREAARAAGTFEFDFTHSGSGETRTFEAMVTDLRSEPAVCGFVFNARDVTERNSMAFKLHLQATTDSLTGLPNRVALVDWLERMLSRNSGATSVSTVCIDLDNFRDINDSLGQDTGDEVLAAVADRLRVTLTGGAQAARIGADEFVVIVESSHGEDTVMDLTASILEQLALPFDIGGRELTLTASGGVAVDHDRDVGAEVLLSNSIAAMHQAKQEGRGRVARFESSMRTASSNRLEIRGDLARAIGTEQIVVNYQPLVDLQTRLIVGAEALVRWDHPQRGRLSPALFIPIAEDSGLIDALDAQVRAQACKDLARWRAEVPGAEDLTVSVNLSVGELRSDDLVDAVMQDLRVSHLPPEALVLEVTESHLLDDSDTVKTKMEQLRSHGVSLAVDDFGTGYSSLGYIDRFEFDVLKIDRSFVAGLATEMNQRIVSAVLDLAGQLNAKVVAEGIEDPSQEEQLREMGCGVGQGYLYSRPVAAQQFRRLLIGAEPALT